MVLYLDCNGISLKYLRKSFLNSFYLVYFLTFIFYHFKIFIKCKKNWVCDLGIWFEFCLWLEHLNRILNNSLLLTIFLYKMTFLNFRVSDFMV